MKPLSDESYEEWLNRASLYELTVAKSRIKNGEDIDLVLNELAKKLTDKFIHPYYAIIHNMYQIKYDPVQSLQTYTDQYLKYFPSSDNKNI